MPQLSVFSTRDRTGSCRTTLRRAAAASGAVSVGLAVAACTGSTGSGTTSAATSTSPLASSAAPSSAPATPPVGTGSTAAGAPTGGGSSGGGSPAPCAESQLQATINFQNPAGTVNEQYHPVIVYFRNTSSTTCTITGYPGAAVVDAQGKQVVEATRTIRGNALGLPVGQDTVPVVTLPPGKYASAGLEGVSTKQSGAAQAGCSASTYPGIIVTPPNTTVPVPFTVPWPSCFSFQVHPVNVEDNPPS